MNVASIIEHHPGDTVALIDGVTRRTYGELRDRVAAMRGGLRARGVGIGDRVGLVGENSVAIVEAYLAIVGSGAVLVPLNRSNPEASTRAELAAVESNLVVVGPGGRAPEGVASVTVDDLAGASPSALVEREGNDLAALLFTSGTAGAPKAAMLTHRNLVSNLEQSVAVSDGFGPGDIVLGVLPIDHIFGLNVMVGLALYVGAAVVLVSRFDAAETVDLIASQKVTVLPGVPTMFVAWSVLPSADRTAFASVRLALSGAAKLSEDTARAFEARTGVPIREGYGLTEASPVVTTSMGAPPKRGSIGRVLPGIEVRLVDGSGGDALAGDDGEIWVRGPNVFAGYWNDADATERVLTSDGWLRTGDVAVVDDDGCFYLVDRMKDLIIVSGFNVYPAEVEDVLSAHRDVVDTAVIGVPHPTTGETVKAFVVLRPNATAGPVELIDHCRDSLARYKCPTTVDIVDELPRGTNGKVLRRVLR